MKAIFQSKRTLRSILTRVKEKVTGVVYQVNCSCASTYIGKIGRTPEVRLKEHQRAVKTGKSSNRIAVYVEKTGHMICWDSTKILEREPIWSKRRYKEAINIKNHFKHEFRSRHLNKLCLEHIN